MSTLSLQKLKNVFIHSYRKMKPSQRALIDTVSNAQRSFMFRTDMAADMEPNAKMWIFLSVCSIGSPVFFIIGIQCILKIPLGETWAVVMHGKHKNRLLYSKSSRTQILFSA